MYRSDEEEHEYPALEVDARNNAESARLLRLLAIADRALAELPAQSNGTRRDKSRNATSSRRESRNVKGF